jgi:hypothetical protein
VPDNTRNPARVVMRPSKTSDHPYTRTDFMRDLAKVSKKNAAKPARRRAVREGK